MNDEHLWKKRTIEVLPRRPARVRMARLLIGVAMLCALWYLLLVVSVKLVLFPISFESWWPEHRWVGQVLTLVTALLCTALPARMVFRNPRKYLGVHSG